MSELHINMMNIMEQSCIDDYFEEEKLLIYQSMNGGNLKVGVGSIFTGPKLREIFIDNFHQKAPKWVKNQVNGPKLTK